MGGSSKQLMVKTEVWRWCLITISIAYKMFTKRYFYHFSLCFYRGIYSQQQKNTLRQALWLKDSRKEGVTKSTLTFLGFTPG